MESKERAWAGAIDVSVEIMSAETIARGVTDFAEKRIAEIL